MAAGDFVCRLVAGSDEPSDGASGGRRVNHALAFTPALSVVSFEFPGYQIVTLIERSLRFYLHPILLVSGVVGFSLGYGIVSLGTRSDFLHRKSTVSPDEAIAQPDIPPDLEVQIASTSTASGAFELAKGRVLSDQEIIELMLRAEDGRMKQKELVETTDWSKAKVSRLLSEMADEETIAKIRLGRENLICLESAQPDASVNRQTDPR